MAVSGQPTKQMADSRTYIFIRIWQDFPNDLDYEAFGNVADDDLPQLVERLYAHGLRLLFASPDATAEAKWAHGIPAPAAERLAIFGDDWCRRLATSHLARWILYHTLPTPPRWILLHAEPSVERARALVESLVIAVSCEPVVRIECIERGSVPLPRSLFWDRELEDWDMRHIEITVLGLRPSLLKRLRGEALKFSALLDRLPPELLKSSPQPPFSAGQEETSVEAQPPLRQEQIAPVESIATAIASPGVDATSDRPQLWRHVDAQGLPLRGWREIADHLGKTNGRAFQEALRRRNDDLNGPIRTICGRPEVDAGQLDAWIEESRASASLAEQRQRNDDFVVTDLEKRDGADMPSQGLHPKRR